MRVSWLTFARHRERYKNLPGFQGNLENDVMTAIAQVISRTTGVRIGVASLSAEFIFGGIMFVVALVGTMTYGLDLSPGFF